MNFVFNQRPLIGYRIQSFGCMVTYHEQIQKIKEKGNVDKIKINYLGNLISLKVVDESEDTIKLLTELRKKYRNMFATNFQMNEERTKKWVRNKLHENDSILFIIYANREKIGNIGTDLYDEKTNSAELDNMMKVPSCNIRGIMTVVEKVYLKWMFDYLKLSKIRGQLFSDNYKMMNAHIKCGWKTIRVLPLKKTITDDGWVWEEKKLESNDITVERCFNAIELTKEDLMQKFGDINYEILSE